MFRKLLGLGGAGPTGRAPAQAYEPYGNGAAANALYGLLFCDDPAAYRPTGPQPPADWQALLYGPRPDAAKVEALGKNPAAESRVRALACNWLRAHGRSAPKGEVMGVIIEVPLDGGLDVLAAYADGTVRYINQTGKLVVIEPDGLPSANAGARALVEKAGPVVARIGAWDRPRLPPPVQPDVRLTFVVSDGLYFGQGPFDVMREDPLSAPLLQEATALLQLVVQAALDGPQP